jgi:hypothetical protein
MLIMTVKLRYRLRLFNTKTNHADRALLDACVLRWIVLSGPLGEPVGHHRKSGQLLFPMGCLLGGLSKCTTQANEEQHEKHEAHGENRAAYDVDHPSPSHCPTQPSEIARKRVHFTEEAEVFGFVEDEAQDAH